MLVCSRTLLTDDSARNARRAMPLGMALTTGLAPVSDSRLIAASTSAGERAATTALSATAREGTEG